jgi:hypothetical protein
LGNRLLKRKDGICVGVFPKHNPDQIKKGLSRFWVQTVPCWSPGFSRFGKNRLKAGLQPSGLHLETEEPKKDVTLTQQLTQSCPLTSVVEVVKQAERLRGGARAACNALRAVVAYQVRAGAEVHPVLPALPSGIGSTRLAPLRFTARLRLAVKRIVAEPPSPGEKKMNGRTSTRVAPAAGALFRSAIRVAVLLAAGLVARVSLGLTARLEQNPFWHPKKRIGTLFNPFIVADPEGLRAEPPRSIGGDEVALAYADYAASHTNRRLSIFDGNNDCIRSVKLDYHASERVPVD